MRYPILYLLLILFAFSCESDCNVDFVEFNSKADAPIIYLTSKKSGCTYSIRGEFWIDKLHFISDGELYVEKDAFYITLDSLGSQRLKYFDFSQRQGNWYEIPVETSQKEHGSVKIMAKIDSVISFKDDNVYLFRMSKAFKYMEQGLDIVFFVTKRRGIIGSYVCERLDGDEIIAVPRGDIMRNRIDYSKKQFGVLK